MVHKKKHDMVLNLGLGARGNTFSDQTPTPTRFIRNCEEVGLFQDLQNVNPFEETFRRAVEAVKTGQTPLLDKSFQTNPCDDTLHTPNVFPHITDLPGGNSNENLGSQENAHLDDNLPKKDDIKNIDDKLHLKTVLEPSKLILGNVSHRKRKISASGKSVVKESQNDGHNDVVTEKKDETYLKNLVSNNNANELNEIQMTIKEKIKNSIYSKEMPVVLQVKVPIPKSNCINRCQKSQKDRFSTFSKNSLKFEYKLEKPQSGIFDLSKKRKVRKNYSGLPKERIEILERNRAAATRCREKKKLYVSYLERLNRELTDANKKLEHHNIYLRQQIVYLQNELLKHQDCSASNLKGGTLIKPRGNALLTNGANVEEFETKGKIAESIENRITSPRNSSISDKLEYIPNVFDTVRVPLAENCPCSGSQDELLPATYSKPYSVKTFNEDKLRNIYTDHSYFNCPHLTDVRKKYSNSTATKPKLPSGFITVDVINQNSVNENKNFNVELPTDESVLEVQTQDVVI